MILLILKYAVQKYLLIKEYSEKDVESKVIIQNLKIVY